MLGFLIGNLVVWWKESYNSPNHMYYKLEKDEKLFSDYGGKNYTSLGS